MGEELATKAVVTVGGGRGFVVETTLGRLVVTAAHCLPQLPEAMPAMANHERTYGQILAPLGDEPRVAVELLFADPVADVAILGPPDDQELVEEFKAFEAIVEAATPILIVTNAGELPRALDSASTVITTMGNDGILRLRSTGRRCMLADTPARLLSLDMRWFSCGYRQVRPHAPLWIVDATNDIRGGMSGSPIVNKQGEAVGVVCVSVVGSGEFSREGGPNPCLPGNLPLWFIASLVLPEPVGP